MLKKISIIILLITQWSFSQTENDDYNIYGSVIGKKLDLQNQNDTKKILLVDTYDEEFNLHQQILNNNSDKVTDEDIDILSMMTHKDTTFLKRFKNEKGLKEIIVQLTYDTSEHPKVESELIPGFNFSLQSISAKKFRSFIGPKKNFKRGWKRLQRKYNMDKIIMFSQVKYLDNFAATFYEYYCGTLCGSGNIVIFEKVNDKWLILTEINLWTS